MGNEISENNAWVNGKNSFEKLKFVPVKFPGYMGNRAAREEYRLEKGTVHFNDVVVIKVTDADRAIDQFGVLTSIVGNPKTKRVVQYTFHMKKVKETLDALISYGDIPVNFPLTK